MVIGIQIQESRKRLNMTQEQLARKVNKKREYISRVENNCGNITLKSLRDIVEIGLGGKLHIEVML
jgi:transcriptional regulator with XRE-family HTH domain